MCQLISVFDLFCWPIVYASIIVADTHSSFSFFFLNIISAAYERDGGVNYIKCYWRDLDYYIGNHPCSHAVEQNGFAVPSMPH